MHPDSRVIDWKQREKVTEPLMRKALLAAQQALLAEQVKVRNLEVSLERARWLVLQARKGADLSLRGLKLLIGGCLFIGMVAGWLIGLWV